MTLKLAAAALAFLAVLGFQGQGIVVRDREGTMEGTGFQSWATRRLNENRLTFLGLGKPVSAKWSRQGMEARAERIEGTVARTGESFELLSASLSGQVRATFERRGPSSSPASVLRVQGDAATYTADRSQLTLTGGVRLAQSEPATGQSFEISGRSATVLLAGGAWREAQEAVRRLDVGGQVRFAFARKGRQGLDLKGRSESLSYDAEQGLLTLTGGVYLQGEDVAYGGEAWADKATIRLDAERNPISVELQGSPAETSVGRKAVDP
ncbi:MAG: LptA/OstA family protein [Fimbriimonadales bacterium]|nr:LptA/OstA family protein [Fimbriimonadales bacterium]